MSARYTVEGTSANEYINIGYEIEAMPNIPQERKQAYYDQVKAYYSGKGPEPQVPAEYTAAKAPRPITPIQALATVAARDPVRVGEAAAVFYPQSQKVQQITYYPAQRLFTVQYAPQVDSRTALASPLPRDPLSVAEEKIGVPAGEIGLQDVPWLAPGRSGTSTAERFGGGITVNPYGLTGEEQKAYLEAGAAKTYMRNLNTVTFVLGVGSFGISPVSAFVGGGLSSGVSQVFKAFGGGGLLTPEEFVSSFTGGAAFSGVSKAVMGAKVFQAAGTTGAFRRIMVNVGLSGGASAIFSGGDPEETLKGLGFGLVFGFASEGISKIVSKRRYDVTKVVGAEEIELSRLTESGVQSKRLTTLRTEKTRAKGAYGRFLRENQRYFIAEGVDVAGEESLFMRGGGEIDLYPQQPYSGFNRPAEPYLAAARGESIFAREVAASSKGTAVRDITTSSKAPGKVYQKTTVTGEFVGGEVTAAKRSLTAVQFFGKIDRQIYLKYLSAMPKDVQQLWLRQMGGLTAKQIALSTGSRFVRVFTDVVGVQPSKVNVPFTVVATPTKQETEQKAGLTTAEKSATLFISSPSTAQKKKAKQTVQINAPPKKQTLSTLSTGSMQRPRIAVSPPILGDLMEEIQIAACAPGQRQPILPSIAQALQQKSIAAPRLATPGIPGIPSSSTRKIMVPHVPFGGGGGEKKTSFSLTRGRWFFKRHPVATLEQNLRNQLGIKIKPTHKSKRKRKRKRW